MALELEYLDEAVVEAAAAAEWYAARSATAAAGFEAELDEAESAIRRLPNAWPAYDHGTRRYLLRRYPFGVVYRSNRSVSSSWPSRMDVDVPDIGVTVCEGLANMRLELAQCDKQ